MKLLDVSKKRIDSLEKLMFDDGIFQTEVDLYVFYNYKVKYLLKELYSFEYLTYDNKLRTLISIDEHSDVIPDYFIKPVFFVPYDYVIRFWGTKFVDGVNLNKVLNDYNIPFAVKKKYLIRIGEILEEMNEIRKQTDLKDFFIGDLHESNFIVNRDGNLMICDVSSMKIGGNKSSNVKYLTPFSLFNKINTTDKYRRDTSNNRVGDYVVDRNTDLYCYMMILLNFITGKRVGSYSEEDFYNCLNYLNYIKIDTDLLSSFNKLLANGDNVNPYEYIESLTEKQVRMARMKRM